MYFPEGLGTDLLDGMSRGSPKEIIHNNTNFPDRDLLVVNQSAASKIDPTPCKYSITCLLHQNYMSESIIYSSFMLFELPSRPERGSIGNTKGQRIRIRLFNANAQYVAD